MAAAAALGVVAIAGGVSAGLESSTKWANDAHAAVIPEVLYLEQEVAKVATIARVNGDIADEVTVDVRVDALARRAAAGPNASPRSSVPSVMDSSGSGGSSDDVTSSPTRHNDGADEHGPGSGGDDSVAPAPSAGSEPRTVESPKPAPAPAPAPAAPEPKAPVVDEPVAPEPAPAPSEPTKGNGTPPVDRGRTAPDKDTKVASASPGTKELAP